MPLGCECRIGAFYVTHLVHESAWQAITHIYYNTGRNMQGVREEILVITSMFAYAYIIIMV